MNKISSALFVLVVFYSTIACSADVKVTTPAEKANFFRWIAKEMMEQVYARPASKRADIETWAGVLLQGGKVEGVYHGIILSTEYDTLEKGVADIRAIRFYASEMAKLEQTELPNSIKEQEASKRLIKESMQKSPFTLKKALGEKILSQFDKYKNDKEKLAMWYADCSSRWAELGIPFGMKQRENKDLTFHQQWAKENNIGLIQWELLNKVHRVINYYSGLKAVEGTMATTATASSPAGK